MADNLESKGTTGVLIMPGSTFTIADLQLSFGPDGVTSTMRPLVAWEIWPLWIQVSLDHLALSRAARRAMPAATDLSGAADLRRTQLLADETKAGLVAASAVAFALEAMALSAARHASLEDGIGRNASSSRRIVEVLKQCFVVPPTMFIGWRQVVIEIFELRNLAVHHDAASHDPLPHPAVNSGVARPVHVYRTENINTVCDVGLWTATTLVRNPRPRLGKTFRKDTEAWPRFGDELLDYAKHLRGQADQATGMKRLVERLGTWPAV